MDYTIIIQIQQKQYYIYKNSYRRHMGKLPNETYSVQFYAQSFEFVLHNFASIVSTNHLITLIIGPHKPQTKLTDFRAT